MFLQLTLFGQSNNLTRINIIHADSYIIKKVDSQHDYIILRGNVVLEDKTTIIKTDSAVSNAASNIIECFGNVKIDDGDSIKIRSKYAFYNGQTKDSKLRNDVQLTDKISTVFTDSFDYNFDTKIGQYTQGGKMVRKDMSIKSKIADYNGTNKIITFYEKVLYTQKTNKIIGDELIYNEVSDLVNINKPAVIYQDKRIIITDSAWYNFKNKKGALFKRSIIIDSGYKLFADNMWLDDSSNENFYQGSVFIKTKEDNYKELHSEYMKTNTNKDYLQAYQDAWALIIQNKSKFYLRADTLIVGKITDLKPDSMWYSKRLDTLPFKLDTTKLHYVMAYHNVKMFNDSIQALCDSFFYTQYDSVAGLYGNPIIWLTNTQLTADTMNIWIKNKEIEKLILTEHSFAINSVDTTLRFFNQLKAGFMNFNFDSNRLYDANMRQNCETIYFLQDNQQRFIGLNKSTSRRLWMRFQNNRPTYIKYIDNIDGKTFPIKNLSVELELRGFHWLEEIRPKKWFDIFY